ncbi:YbaN family protein [Aestuariirhabdus sp. Z084]|uniref:YbaN family protein n=1 Tax=Aestuariirhabdus haliotis TaxID=2918751 RepID=UPI00201B4308|nr:YbaN family protein [Aestuariirhabdus haliotis]MCL6417312.1 YbaN family protein [Aestuariirhabdus haliotis]MCL6421257.1 YbaN family protein [Aestuariirhabdus haliotis]
MSPASQSIVKNPLLRATLFVCGWLAVVLGVAGIFLPVLPTTPFLLLAAACFLRSSERFYLWLLEHPKLGNYISYYLDGEGIPAKARFYTLCLLWGTILLSVSFLNSWPLRLMLLVTASGVSIYLLRMKTRAEPTALGPEQHQPAHKAHPREETPD